MCPAIALPSSSHSSSEFYQRANVQGAASISSTENPERADFEPPELLSAETEAMREAVEETVEGSLRSFVEFDEETFHLVYVDDVSLSFYEDEAEMMEHFEQIHSYVHLDFMEKGFFTEDIFPLADRVRYITTSLGVFTIVRVYFGDEGLFLALDSGEEVEPVAAAVEAVYEE